MNPLQQPADEDNPLTVMTVAAVQLHELYQTYVAAGFSPAQAMQIVCTVLSISAQAQP